MFPEANFALCTDLIIFSEAKQHPNKRTAYLSCSKMKTEGSSVDNKSLSTKCDDNDNQKLSVEIGITEEQVLDQNLEKKVLRKLDWNLMTLFSLLFLFSNLGMLFVKLIMLQD